MKDPCKQAGCERPQHARGMCASHYQRWLRDGAPEKLIRRGTRNSLEEALEAHVTQQDDGCWVWTGYRDKLGYGRFSYGEMRGMAHRAYYEAHAGPVPDGLELDHLCRNPACVRPDHLEPVTHQENIRRGYAAKRAEDAEGHLPVEGIEHGQSMSYLHSRCRCEPCTQAHSERMARLKAQRRERLSRDPSIVEHGLASTYGNWGCRCEPCVEAHFAAYRSYVDERANREAGDVA